MAKCPICGKNKDSKEEIIDHIESIHSSMVPDSMSTAQYIYSLNHDGRSHGLCRICNKPTQWNEKTGKPYQLCGSTVCKKRNREIYEERMMKSYGKTTLLDDIDYQQNKMLANRRISDTYTWSDKIHKFTYTGSYEKFAIEWIDKVADVDPEYVQMPGPVLEYEYKGEKRKWITDLYLADFNLIIEIKAGLDENKHPGFAYQRELEHAKDESMKRQKTYNYAKITHRNMMSLVKVLADIRMNNVFAGSNNNVAMIYAINESTVEDNILPDINNISNTELDTLYESVYRLYNEGTIMSVSGLSPISKPITNESQVEETNKKLNTNMYSDPAQDTWNPFSSTDNFSTNEDMNIDMQSDPMTSISPESQVLPVLGISIFNSNFREKK